MREDKNEVTTIIEKVEFLGKVKGRLKYVPTPVNELAEDQDLLKLMDMMIAKDSALTEETRVLVALGAATALECEDCIREFKNAALSSGVPQEKVNETILLAGFIATSSYARIMATLTTLTKLEEG